MRNIKELLELMLENQDLFCIALCDWTRRLHGVRFICQEEKMTLLYYIQKNRPSMWSSIDAFRYRKRSYYWEEGNIKPRIKWIKKHIKLNSTS